MSFCDKFQLKSLGWGGVGGWVEHVVTVSNLNPSYIEWDLGLGFDSFHPRYIYFELELGLGFDNVSFYIHNS